MPERPAAAVPPTDGRDPRLQPRIDLLTAVLYHDQHQDEDAIALNVLAGESAAIARRCAPPPLPFVPPRPPKPRHMPHLVNQHPPPLPDHMSRKPIALRPEQMLSHRSPASTPGTPPRSAVASSGAPAGSPATRPPAAAWPPPPADRPCRSGSHRRAARPGEPAATQEVRRVLGPITVTDGNQSYSSSASFQDVPLGFSS